MEEEGARFGLACLGRKLLTGVIEADVAPAAELGALATMSKVRAVPGGANGFCSAVHAWLDARAADEETLETLVARVMEWAVVLEDLACR